MGIKLRPYPEYKESGVPWLGRIPAQWTVKRAKYFYREVDERSASGKEELLSVSHITGVTPRSQKNVSMFMAESTVGYKLCRNDDLVINTMWAWMAALGISRQIGLVSPAYAVYRPFLPSPLRAEYVDHVLRLPCYATEYLIRSTGITASRLRMYPDQFLRIPILCPPDNDQEAVIGFLVKIGQRLARLIRLKRRMIDLLTEQKQAIIHRAVTRGIDPNVRLKPSGIDWLGDVPVHWELKRAKQVCGAIVDCKNRTPDMVMGGEYTVVRTTNIRNGEFHLAGSYSTDRQNFEIWTQRGAPRAGDVFFTREAPVGEACLVPVQGNLCMGQRMMYFRPDSTVLDSNFMLNNIYGPLVRRYIEIESNGSTVGHLRLGQVSALPLLWCPLDEQKKIVAYIRTESTPLNTAALRLGHEIDLLREYRTRLIADVVTGKLDVRGVALPDLAEAPAAWDDGDPTEEPPEEESAPED